ncbi:MAG: hypothetical protein ACTHJ4_06865 [Candidatus Nucleicultricaceae bacterium]
MKNRNILSGIALIGILAGLGQEANASQQKIYPLTNQMINAIKTAPGAELAKDLLCEQGGIIRGSGLSAGNNCKLQDFARVALVACHDYKKGTDSFKGSKCEKKAAEVSITEVQRASESLKAAVTADVQYVTNANLLICGPKELGDKISEYRAKLPAGLKKIADVACPKIAPVRPTTAAPAIPKRQVAELIKQDLEIAKAIQQSVSLGSQELGKAKLPQQRINLDVTTMSVVQRKITMIAKNEPQKAASLNEAAKKVADELSNMLKIFEAKGEDVPADKMKEIQSFKTDIQKAETVDDVLKELMTLKQEASNVVTTAAAA